MSGDETLRRFCADQPGATPIQVGVARTALVREIERERNYARELYAAPFHLRPARAAIALVTCLLLVAVIALVLLAPERIDIA